MKTHRPSTIWVSFLLQSCFPSKYSVAKMVLRSRSGEAPSNPRRPSKRTPSSTAEVLPSTCLSSAVRIPALVQAFIAKAWRSSSRAPASLCKSPAMKLSKYICHQVREGEVECCTWANHGGGGLPFFSSRSGGSPLDRRISRETACITDTLLDQPMGRTLQAGLYQRSPRT